MRPRAEIILPCFNPPRGWQEEVSRLYLFLLPKFDVHFTIVDDGTTNENIKESIGALHRDLPVKLIQLGHNKGKGFALRQGVTEADRPFQVYTDIDIPFTPESVERLLIILCKGEYDIVAGYRDNSYYEDTMSGPRRRLSKTFRVFMRRILKISLDDTQCGLKGFNSKGRKIFLSTKVNRYLFDFEFIYQALRSSELKVGSVSVQLKKDVQFSSMKWHVIIREGMSLAGVLWRSAWKRG